MVPFGFTITPPESPMPLSAYPHFAFTTGSTTFALDMQRRIDTIAASPAAAAAGYQDLQDDSWSTPAPTSYDMDRAAAIAHKIAQEELALLTPAAVLHLGGHIGVPFEHEVGGALAAENKAVRFTGLYVVNGPTESKHIRYAMEIAVPELQLRTRCIQRFQSFYQLRKRLLKVTKRCCCHHVQPEQYYNSNTRNSSKLDLLHSSWDELPFTASSRGCCSCRRVRKSLKMQAFPRRKIFTMSTADVQTRSLQLEAFLSVCTRLLVDWSGCERGKKLFAGVMGKFLGVNILQQLFPSRYGRGSGSGYSLVMAANHMEVGSDGGFGGSEYAQSVATTGLSTRSESSYTTPTTAANGGAGGPGSGSGFHVGGAPSCRLLLSTFLSSSSLSLHDEDECR